MVTKVLCSQKGPKHPSPLTYEAISHIAPSQPPAKPSYLFGHYVWPLSGACAGICHVQRFLMSCPAVPPVLFPQPSSGQDPAGTLCLPAAVAIFITQPRWRTGCRPLYPWLQRTALWLFMSGWARVGVLVGCPQIQTQKEPCLHTPCLVQSSSNLSFHHAARFTSVHRENLTWTWNS